MKKIISRALIITMICLNISAPIFAEGNDILRKFQEYNFKKLSLYMSVVELYKYGYGLDKSIDINTQDDRRIQIRKEPEYSDIKNRISWFAINEDKLLTEEQLYSVLGLEEEAKKALKANKNSKSMFYGGTVAFGIGFLMLSSLNIKSSNSFESEPNVLAGLLTAGGAVAMLVGNKTSVVHDIDYIDVYKLDV